MITKEAETTKAEDLPKLSQIYFYLTEGCNLACRHCWIAPKFDADHRLPSLPVSLIETAIAEAKDLGLKGVKLTGGEPLMHPRFLEILEIIRREDLRLEIESNGILCTPEVAAEIAGLPRRSISISIDGADAKTHEWIRGVPGCFEKAKDAVRNLVAVGIRPQIIMTLMRRNADQMGAIIRMAEDLGASSLKFNIVQPTARGEHLSTMGETLSISELIKMGRDLEKDPTFKTDIPVIFDWPHSFNSLSNMAKGNGCGRCNVLGIIGVIASGHYALCGIGYHNPELVFGKVGKDRLDEIWKNNQVLSALRSGLPQRLEGICSRCLMKYSCLGSCIAQNYYGSKSLWAPYWFCDQAYREGLFPETRIFDK